MRHDAEIGEKYISAFPYLRKWINECNCCHEKGYNPDMPEHVGGKYSLAADYIRKNFKPLQLNSDGLCPHCESILKGEKLQIINDEPKTQKRIRHKTKSIIVSDEQITAFKTIVNAISYESFIEGINNGTIQKIEFEIKDYAHYKKCVIRRRDDFIDILLTKDGSENVGFFRTFEENCKLFKIKGATYTLKQVWNKVVISQVTIKE